MKNARIPRYAEFLTALFVELPLNSDVSRILKLEANGYNSLTRDLEPTPHLAKKRQDLGISKELSSYDFWALTSLLMLIK